MSVRVSNATERLYVTATGPVPSSGFTATMWLWLSVDQNTYACFLRPYTGSTTVVTVSTNDDGQTPSAFTAGGSVIGPTTMSVGAWYRVAVTVNGSTAKIYVASGS